MGYEDGLEIQPPYEHAVIPEEGWKAVSDSELERLAEHTLGMLEKAYRNAAELTADERPVVEKGDQSALDTLRGKKRAAAEHFLTQLYPAGVMAVKEERVDPQDPDSPVVGKDLSYAEGIGSLRQALFDMIGRLTEEIEKEEDVSKKKDLEAKRAKAEKQVTDLAAFLSSGGKVTELKGILGGESR